jgi:hypothetical protein
MRIVRILLMTLGAVTAAWIVGSLLAALFMPVLEEVSTWPKPLYEHLEPRYWT